MRKLRVLFENGECYDIPVDVILDSRAEHYADVDGIDFEEYVKLEPHDSVDDYDIKDWASNNMDWSDVKVYAVKVHESNHFDYEYAFTNADKEVINE